MCGGSLLQVRGKKRRTTHGRRVTRHDVPVSLLSAISFFASNLHLLSRDQAHDTPTHQVLVSGHSPLGGSRVTLTGRDVTRRDVTVGGPRLTTADQGTCVDVVDFSRRDKHSELARHFVT